MDPRTVVGLNGGVSRTAVVESTPPPPVASITGSTTSPHQQQTLAQRRALPLAHLSPSALRQHHNHHHHNHNHHHHHNQHHLHHPHHQHLHPAHTPLRSANRRHLSAAALKQRNHTAATASRYSARARMIARRTGGTTCNGASRGEYRNLRQSVPALRRQRDVGKLEVVTEAARYIDHLHRTLIERFMLCGIPDTLKGLLGTSDAGQLSPRHIMHLVTRLAAAKQQQQQQQRRRRRRPSPPASSPGGAHLGGVGSQPLPEAQQPLDETTHRRRRGGHPATRLTHSQVAPAAPVQEVALKVK